MIKLDLLNGLRAGKNFFWGMFYMSKVFLQILGIVSIFVLWFILGVYFDMKDEAIVVLKLLQTLVSTLLISLFFYLSLSKLYNYYFKKKFSETEQIVIKDGRKKRSVKKKKSSK